MGVSGNRRRASLCFHPLKVCVVGEGGVARCGINIQMDPKGENKAIQQLSKLLNALHDCCDFFFRSCRLVMERSLVSFTRQMTCLEILVQYIHLSTFILSTRVKETW